MTKNRVFLDIHVIQSMPPSNVNRDDTGSPKTAQYGGVQRARVSSQSWKRAMRNYFKENGELENVGVRTKEIVAYVADKIQVIDQSIDREEAMKMSGKVIKAVGLRPTADQKVKSLFFMGDREARDLAEAAISGNNNKEEMKDIMKSNSAIDIALFGRMVAESPSLNEDASSQVAHAISTHAVQTEFDYYTAIADFSSNEHAGAEMIDTIEYNSSTLYRYANIAVHELSHQLSSEREKTINTIDLYIKAFLNSLPTGKINTFANQTLPQAVLISIRDDRPVNLVTAFENPIKSTTGYGKESVERLLAEEKKSEKLLRPAVVNLFLNISQWEVNDEHVKTMANLNDLLSELNPVIESLIK